MSESGSKLVYSLPSSRAFYCTTLLLFTAGMLSRNQLRLLRTILALDRTHSAQFSLRWGPGAFYSTATAPQSPLTKSLSIPFRHFATSLPLSKKGKAPKDVPVPDSTSEKAGRLEIDPYDYSELESGISKAIVRLREALTKTRSAGRISPDTIENLTVQVNIKHDPGASGKGHKESGRLADYATVVPKGGRMMQVFVADESV